MKNGWTRKTLGQLCQLISGQHIDAKDYNAESRGVGYLTGPSDFGPLNPVISKWTEHPKVKAKCGDVLITVKGSGVGKINLLDQDEVAISRQLMAVRVTGADPRFVHAILSSTFDHFQSLSTGAAIPGISREQVLGLKIALPPFPEQQRIVGILDEAFDGIATAKANAEKNLRNASALFESHLQSVFSQRGEGWEEKRLGEVADSISTGPFGTMLHKSDYVPDGIPLVNPMNIVDSRIVPSSKMMVNEKTRKRLSGYVLKAGDIVIGRRGELGRCALVTDREEGWLCGTGSFFVRLSDCMDGKFFVALFGSQQFKARLEGSAVGTTMSSLNHGILNDLRLPVPPIAVQRKAMTKADDLLAETQRLEAIYQQKLTALEALKKSLLHQAFSGQLTRDNGELIRDNGQ